MQQLHSYELEQVSSQAQFILQNESGPYGRLYVKVLPAYAPDGNTPIYVLELTARGSPQGDGIHGALAFLDLGRDAIVRAFIEMTTETMHQEWGLQS